MHYVRQAGVDAYGHVPPPPQGEPAWGGCGMLERARQPAGVNPNISTVEDIRDLCGFAGQGHWMILTFGAILPLNHTVSVRTLRSDTSRVVA